MIGFVELLPAKWQPRWDEIQAASGRDLEELVRLNKKDCEKDLSKLEQKFKDQVHDPELEPLLSVIEGLMRFLPSGRITTDEALQMLDSYQGTIHLE
ncbi:hypothetical protein N7520_001294 [Penicillium odoratum]|uniref:uncharacterized protein n=1 Tax=Penicillium odoratum TaxID=1167516 RepID=UPI00254894FE|nr:uncharacterized protein N7520_001294 [Penicillium odoratum]KAJ5778048.1 hypothetical protein N7520_001294 [Penicillium odoratum]